MTAAFSGPIDFADGCITTLKADSTLSDKVAELFLGRHLRYFVGIDEAFLPEASNCPYLAFQPGDYQIDSSDAFKRMALRISLIVAKTGEDTEDALVVRMKSLVALEELVPIIIGILKPYCVTKFGRPDGITFSAISTTVVLPLSGASFSIEAQDDI